MQWLQGCNERRHSMALIIPKEGDILTISGDIITIGGQVIFEKGEKVIVSDVVIEKSHWSWGFSGIYYPDKLIWVKLEGHYGLWQPNTFEELCEKIVTK